MQDDEVIETGQDLPGGRPSYAAPAGAPTQAGPSGIRFDFNDGARVALPARKAGQWRVRLRDLDTGNVLYETDAHGKLVRSSKRYYVRFGIEVWDVPDGAAVTPVLTHEYDACGRDVLIQFPDDTVSGVLGWFPYAVRFWQVSFCRLFCAMPQNLIDLLSPAYPDINFVTPETAAASGLTGRVYATYNIGLFFDDPDHVFQPTDFRHVGLHRVAGFILGVDPCEAPPKLVLPDESRPIDGPYVCIGVQGTMQCKYWNNPDGWRGVILHLRAQGYRVVCIDQMAVNGGGIVWNHVPHGAQDETGDRPLAERARWLRHAAGFIGVGGGLAWLAWAAGTPVVLISGFTHPTTEFATPYRVINWHACNSCWNDVRHCLDPADFLWCPRHAGTSRHFECTRLITTEQVINVLKRLPTLPPIQRAA